MKARCLMMWLALLLVQVVCAELSVKNIKVQQRWPWNGLVDIDYEVVCDDPQADVYVYFTGKDNDLNRSVKMMTLTGEGAENKPVKAGKHRVTWNMAKDEPNLHTTAFSLHIQAAQGDGLYLVISLKDGPESPSYPYRYSSKGPDLTNDVCRGEELWLRFIPAGSFMYNGNQMVTFDKGFYMGVFELTEKQWALVMKTKNETESVLPIAKLVYNIIRGANEGHGYPKHMRVDADSFIGVLRRKTGLNFDIPNLQEWEYACRAGTTGNVNVEGAKLSDVANYRVDVNKHYARQKGGLLLPNAWGLYDMLGNMIEMTRNLWGTSPGYDCGLAGGSYGSEAKYCTPTTRDYDSVHESYYNNYATGIRLVIVPGK